MSTVLATTHASWYASRAAGTAALALASASVGYGLLTAGRMLPRKLGGRRIVHEALSLATLVAIAVHGLVLLGDTYMNPSLADVLIPFASSYQRWWTSLGIVAGWTLVVLGLSYYVRARIGVARWRVMHRFTLLAWLAGIAHSLGEGTDAGKAWFVAMLAIAIAPALAMAVLRLAGRAPRGPGATPAPPAAPRRRVAA
ncbi:hypothetical protein FSW04_07230 [Baekduia soli]|uniref:Ferric oxidoreductase domain-containing protein n=1 Tax=Baekduia soli TaxID=496014 RepID=A0A5B8U2Z9_9ACTN|nr:hypothetical protein [Baekduia soli]QEC47394.1 hypothetical protein FSW04_07230 [Baekduia soli]